MKRIFAICTVCLTLLFAGCGVSKQAADFIVTVMDAGKADAILIQSENKNILIDTGLEENKESLISELKEKGVETIDVLIITHFDKDHVGGADAVLNTFQVNKVYTTYAAKESEDVDEFETVLKETGVSSETVTDQLSFTEDEAVFTIYGAKGGYTEDESNNSSLIVEMVYGEKTYLFMGDAENERIEEFLAEYKGNADVIKMPHHGNYHKQLDSLIKTLKPSCAVITDSDTEPEETELEKTRTLLSENGVKTYETRNGAITILISSTSFSLTQS